MLEQNIIKVLKQTRKAMRPKMNQTQVAEALDVSSKTVYRIESQYVPLTLTLFLALCNLYGVEPEQIIIEAKNIN